MTRRMSRKDIASELAQRCVVAIADQAEDSTDSARYIASAIERGIELATATDLTRPHLLEYEAGDHPGVCNCGKFDSDPIHQLNGEHRIADILLRSGVPEAEELIRWMEQRRAINERERELANAVLAWVDEARTGRHASVDTDEIARRARALLRRRQEAEATMCGHVPIGDGFTYEGFRDNGDGTCSLDHSTTRDVVGFTCALGRGHDGYHEDATGRFLWR